MPSAGLVRAPYTEGHLSPGSEYRSEEIGINKRETGARYEAYAARYLEQQGFRILERNFHSRRGEVDLIAAEGGTLVFVEVKYRTDRRAGTGAEAVGIAKQRRITGCARYYLMLHPRWAQSPCRFDVISIDGGELKHYRDAFWM